MENNNEDVLKYDDEVTTERKVSSWGHSWGACLQRECAMLGISPGDTIEVTIRVLKRNPYVPHDSRDEDTGE